MLKTLATAPNKSKRKEKGFSFLLDLKRPHIACAISVASAERDATLMDAKSARFFNRLDCALLSVWHEPVFAPLSVPF
jgi:hypothetical protein